MKTLTIAWQRLVDSEGRTCDRCGGTQAELEKAVATLEQALAPLGIAVSLEASAIDPDGFQQDPWQSNRIWIAGKPIEEWLGASSSSSQCCSVCGDSDCRTIEVEGESFEVVPASLILKAGLVAAAGLVTRGDEAGRGACAPGCCKGH